MKLLIFKVNQLGDNVVFLPSLQDLQHRFPDWCIHVLTSPSAATLYRGLLPPEQLHVYPTQEYNKAWKNPLLFTRLYWQLRQIQAEASLLAEDQGNSSHLLARLCGGRLRVGSRRPFVKVPGSLTAEVATPKDKSSPLWSWLLRRRLLEELKLPTGPELPPAPDIRHLLDPNAPAPASPYVLIHPGGSLPYKRWFLDRYAALANELAGEVPVVWVAHDLEPPVELSAEITIYRPENLQAFIQHLSFASLMIGNHSGPFHLANALGIPTLILSGPTRPGWDPIWHQNITHILRDTSLACLPCDSGHQPANACFNQEAPMACMKAWSVEHLAQRARQLLCTTTPSR